MYGNLLTLCDRRVCLRLHLKVQNKFVGNIAVVIGSTLDSAATSSRSGNEDLQLMFEKRGGFVEGGGSK